MTEKKKKTDEAEELTAEQAVQQGSLKQGQQEVQGDEESDEDFLKRTKINGPAPVPVR